MPAPKKRTRRLSLHQLFNLLDADGDGTLVRSEVVAAAAKLGMTQDEAAALFHDLDKDGSGTLTREELSVIESFSHYFSKGPRFSLTLGSTKSPPGLEPTRLPREDPHFLAHIFLPLRALSHTHCR